MLKINEQDEFSVFRVKRKDEFLAFEIVEPCGVDDAPLIIRRS